MLLIIKAEPVRVATSRYVTSAEGLKRKIEELQPSVAFVPVNYIAHAYDSSYDLVKINLRTDSNIVTNVWGGTSVSQLECRDLLYGTKSSERLTPDEAVEGL